MTTPQFFSASQLAVYAGAIAAAADEFVAATGELTITPAVWDAAGLGPFNNGVTMEGIEELTSLMFQGSHGLEDEARITLARLYDGGPQLQRHAAVARPLLGQRHHHHGGGRGPGGHSPAVLNRPLKKPSHGIQIVIDSPFNVEVNGVQAKALVYLPKARLSVSTIGMDVDPEASAVELTIQQQNHADAAYIDFLFADHT